MSFQNNREEVKNMFQRVEIVGYVGKDPELRYLPTGSPVGHFSVATTRRWTNDAGGPGEETVWFRVTAWRRLAEICNEYLTKGRQVLVEGRLQPDPETGGPRVWVGDDGNARAQFEITAQRVIFLGKGDGERPADALPGAPPAPPDESDVPF